ncbi:hypothetical protein ACFQ1S_29120, partial [Kibdelosporangium lantanae]
MTGERPRGSSIWRLLAAFVLVALSSVALLTIAALVGTDRGLTSSEAADRQQAATRKLANWPNASRTTTWSEATESNAQCPPTEAKASTSADI